MLPRLQSRFRANLGISKQSIKLRRLQKSPSEKYGLMKMASDLLSWLLSKNYEEFNLHLSPDVEDNLKLGIGIDVERSERRISGNYLISSARKLQKRPSSKPKLFLWRKDSMTRPFMSFSARSLTLRNRLFELSSHSFGKAA
jgi:hypothetical protein